MDLGYIDPAPEERHHGEVSMQSFIQKQMMVILQPFVDEVQELDAQLAQLSANLGKTDKNLLGTQKTLDETQSDVLSLRSGLKATNDNVAKAHDGIQQCGQYTDALQQGLELTNSYVQRIQAQAESTEGTTQDLQRSATETDCEIQALRANLQRTSDSLMIDVARSLEQMGSDIEVLKSGQTKSSTDLSHLKADFDQSNTLLQETRRVLDKNNADTAALQKNNDALTSREAQLGAHLMDWKNQWSKLHPQLDAVRKDAAQLKQRSDQHDSIIHSLQQGNATNFGGMEGLQTKHDKLSGEVQALRQGLSTTQQGVAETVENVTRGTAFANKLHTSLQKTDEEAQKASLRVDGLEVKSAALADSLDKATSSISDLSRDQRKAHSTAQSLQHELDKTNASVATAHGLTEAAHVKLHELRSELGRTSEAVKKLDQATEFCRASFTGMQKGFVETSAQLSSRPVTLPKMGRSVPPGLVPRPSPRSCGEKPMLPASPRLASLDSDDSTAGTFFSRVSPGSSRSESTRRSVARTDSRPESPRTGGLIT